MTFFRRDETKMDETDSNVNAPSEENRVVNKFASVLWRLDQGDDLPEEKEARKEAYGAVRKEYRIKARKMQRQLERNGVVLSYTEGGEEA